MGFSLVGNSGDQQTTTNQTTNNYSASINPQLDQEGSGAGAFALNISPTSEGGSTGEIDPDISDYYAPVDISSVGSAVGDSALASLASIANTQAQSQNPSGTPTTTTLQGLLSGDAIYWILGAIVLLFLAHHK